jgi:hypothetical protein
VTSLLPLLDNRYVTRQQLTTTITEGTKNQPLFTGREIIAKALLAFAIEQTNKARP